MKELVSYFGKVIEELTLSDLGSLQMVHIHGHGKVELPLAFLLLGIEIYFLSPLPN
jgi:hypothetical protein